jgi:hypothetical protein
MDKATDIGTLLEVKDWIYNEYYIHEECLEVRMVLNDIITDIIYTTNLILNEMHDEKVGLDD